MYRRWVTVAELQELFPNLNARKAFGMGNHDAGRAMVAVGCALADQREKTGQSAREILDIACKDYRGCDAEFDDDAHPDYPFGKLITEAFMPEGGPPEGMDSFTTEDGSDWWFENVYKKFSDAYGLC